MVACASHAGDGVSRRRWLAVAALAAAGMLGWIGLRKPATTAVAAGGPIADHVAARGVIDAKNGVAKVRSLVDGRALRVLVRAGDKVQTGQLLAEIESDTIAAELTQREAEQRAAAASVGSIREGSRPEERAALEAEARAARHEWEYAKGRADQDERLFATGGLSASARDATVETERVKQALMEEAESRLRLARAGGRMTDVVAARERAQAAEAAARLAQHLLDRTRLVAPIDGLVLVRRLDPGDTVITVTNPPPLFEIADVSETEVRIEVEEAEATRMAVGLSVKVTLPGSTAALGSARVTKVSPRLERRTIDADDARVRAEGLVRVAWLEWTEGQRPSLALGQHLDAIIQLAPQQVPTLVPRAAVAVRDGRATVRVPMGLWASERTVELGLADEGYVEVRGIEAGTRVLLP
jgi:multidrug efflux pump subunit AcrA (membrane-fusion protein)